MVNPAAAPDETGEWLELYNAGDVAVNLDGWQLADLDSDRHVIVGEYWLQPRAYIVLGRENDVNANGGVAVAYEYDGLALANEADELLLLTPWGTETDRLHWGEGTPLRVPKGASLERTGFGEPANWAEAARPWPGSAGDFGSPGTSYAPPPTITETPTDAPTETPLLLPTPTQEPPEQVPPIHLSEIMANPAAVADEAGEWL